MDGIPLGFVGRPPGIQGDDERPKTHHQIHDSRFTTSGRQAGQRVNRKSQIANARRGAVLLEVVLALVLFAAAAAIIGAGLHSAMHGVERQKLNAHASNLAVSVLSEIQMGLRPAESGGPESFESPFDHWTWQLVLTPTETENGEPGDLTLVEVIIRHDDPARVQRLSQVLKLEKKSTATLTAGLQP
jgi:type II secretory pathway pseudopilin PulG